MLINSYIWGDRGVWDSYPGEGQESQTPRAPIVTLRRFPDVSYFDGNGTILR